MENCCHSAAGKSTASGHPLDPLTLTEIARAQELLMAERPLGDAARYPIIELREPTRVALEAGTPPREAFLVVMNALTGAAFEAIVDLSAGKVRSVKDLVTDHHHGQPPIMVAEFFQVADVVKAYPPYREAMKLRGLDDADIDLIQIDPISPGYFDFEPYQGKRVVRAVSYYRANFRDNAYAHPIEGIVAVVDLIEGKVLDFHDDGRLVPIPKAQINYDSTVLPPPRADMKPLEIIQPEGPSFTVDGWHVTWQDWRFRVGFTPREGLVLHQLSVVDGEADRPIIHRASITEMAVPYTDPNPQHFAKCAFDAGEFGLGKLANTLELGCDCLGHIHYFDVPAADDFGKPFVMRNAICMHEEDFGILWKHNEFRQNVHETRRSRRLVISFFATVGNYDYGFYWYLYQDGTIQLEAKLTGIIQTTAVFPGDKYQYGGMVRPDFGGPTHQHFFNARLHMAVDGTGNSVTEHEYHPVPMGPNNPTGNVFEMRSRVLTNEKEAIRDADGVTGRFWKVVNPNVTNGVGNHPGYKLIAMPGPALMADPQSSLGKRAGFARHHVWVTPFDPAERYASGEYPNQRGGYCGLPEWVEQKRDIVNKDIVLWHNFGHTHVCKPEDFPIMAVEYAGFTLKPNNFFWSNPSMNLPPSASGGHGSKRNTCCD